MSSTRSTPSCHPGPTDPAADALPAVRARYALPAPPSHLRTDGGIAVRQGANSPCDARYQRAPRHHTPGPPGVAIGVPQLDRSDHASRTDKADPDCRDRTKAETRRRDRQIPARQRRQVSTGCSRASRLSPAEGATGRSERAGRPDVLLRYRLIRRPALAEIVGDGRPWTVLMISLLSMPWR